MSLMIRSLFLRLLPAIMSTLTQLCFVNVINPNWRVIMHGESAMTLPLIPKSALKIAESRGVLSETSSEVNCF